VIIGPDHPHIDTFETDEAQLWLWAFKAGEFVSEGMTPREAATRLVGDLLWTSAMEDVDPTPAEDMP
jgi:hypothetical protein